MDRRSTRAKQAVYAATALLGLAATSYYNVQFMTGEGGRSAGDFLAGGFANPASSSLSVDLFVVTLAFLIWSFFEARRLEMRRWWLYVLATFFVAIAVSFPVFLMVREAKLAKAA